MTAIDGRCRRAVQTDGGALLSRLVGHAYLTKTIIPPAHLASGACGGRVSSKQKLRSSV